MLNFSPDHLDRHPTVEAYGAAKARIFENQDARRLGGDQRRRSGGARAGAPRPRARGGCSRAARRSPTAPSSTAAGSSIGAARATERLVPLDAIQLLGPHLVDDVMAAADGRRDRRRGAGGDDRGGRGVPRPRARDGAGRRDRRRAVRQRLEGDQRRVGAAIDRELRSRAGARSSAAGSRAAIFGLLREPLRGARDGGRRDRRGAAAACARRWRASCPCTRPASLGEAVARAFALATAGGRGAARAGVRELRHVPRLRGARTAVQGGSRRD